MVFCISTGHHAEDDGGRQVPCGTHHARGNDPPPGHAARGRRDPRDQRHPSRQPQRQPTAEDTGEINHNTYFYLIILSQCQQFYYLFEVPWRVQYED